MVPLSTPGPVSGANMGVGGGAIAICSAGPDIATGSAAIFFSPARPESGAGGADIAGASRGACEACGADGTGFGAAAAIGFGAAIAEDPAAPGTPILPVHPPDGPR